MSASAQATIQTKIGNLDEIHDDTQTKPLGAIWKSSRDGFQFKITDFDKARKLKKRWLLSNKATIYDPFQRFGIPKQVGANLQQMKSCTIWSS